MHKSVLAVEHMASAIKSVFHAVPRAK